MATGIIKWFNITKGFGFIVPDTGGKDVFAHISGMAPGFKPADGQKVTYDMGEDRAGRPVADNVQAA